MASTTIPSFLLPRGISISNATLHHHTRILRRFKSSSTPSKKSSKAQGQAKGPVLEKPDKFRPPSHPARRVVNTNRSPPRNYPGPAPSAREAEEKRTRQYPNMFPPEGTVMFKFLTNRGIHVWISMGVLFSLAAFTFTTNFKQTSPVANLLPSWSGILTNPFGTVGQFITVMKMHSEHTTLESSERRKRRLADVDKRTSYRKAHGLEPDDEPEAEAGAGTGADDNSPTNDAVDASIVIAEGADAGAVNEDGTERKRRPVKKWFGIW